MILIPTLDVGTMTTVETFRNCAKEGPRMYRSMVSDLKSCSIIAITLCTYCSVSQVRRDCGRGGDDVSIHSGTLS